MDPLLLVILFVFGVVIGSFLNVVTMRYDGAHFLFDAKMIGGRSHCPHCKKTLRWFELVPIVSFLVQGGRCRRCKAKLSVQYPIVELLSGLIFVFVPYLPLTLGAGVGVSAFGTPLVLVAALWVAAFEALLVMAVIDIRMGIIPDEVNIFLAAFGVLLTVALGVQAGTILSAVIGAAVAGVFFAALIAVTRGKGMGMGDLKLAIPLGLLFGWPGIVLVLIAAFVIGAVFGVAVIVAGKNTMKGTVPFGPFLALGAATAFFWGPQIMSWYLSLLGIR